MHDHNGSGVVAQDGGYIPVSTVPLKGKLPPSRETRLVSRETCLERNETSLERNETSLVSRECTGSTNISHSSVFEIRIKMSVSYRFDYRGRHYFHSRQLCVPFANYKFSSVHHIVSYILVYIGQTFFVQVRLPYM